MAQKSDLLWLILLAAITCGLYANSVSGEFVYDDKRQVAGNRLIQDPSLYGTALSMDVWAFKGDGTVVASNYWRPTFTAWCILNFRLFGLAPAGWHVTNILLQLGVCLLGFLLLRRWGLGQFTAAAIMIVFAAHPVHSESVAWIAGSPDLLFSIFLLGSLWFAESINDPEKKRVRNRYLAAALLLYLFALGAKEVAFLCFPLFFLILWKTPEPLAGKPKKTTSASQVDRFYRALPFAIAAGGYFLLRLMLLGQISRPAEGAPGLKSALLTAPSIFVFYLKQIVYPNPVAVNYGMRPIDHFSFSGVILPLLISAAAIAILWQLGKRTRVQRIGLALFTLPLVMVFNSTAFLPEQIVHDRYLYLPLLGFLMVVVPALEALLVKYLGERAKFVVLALSVIVSIPLALQTVRINRTWLTELALWTHAVSVDPNSASNWTNLASEYSEENRLQDSVNAYDRSVSIRPAAVGYIGKSQVLIKLGRVNEGIKELRAVTALPTGQTDFYTLYQAYEAEAVAYQQLRDPASAEAVLREGRDRLPLYRATLTAQLSVILYGEGRKEDALKELEGARDQARTELLPGSKAVFLRLGMLYSELGRKDEAKSNLQEFLNWTATTKDKETNQERQQAVDLLKQLNN